MTEGGISLEFVAVELGIFITLMSFLGKWMGLKPLAVGVIGEVVIAGLTLVLVMSASRAFTL